MASNKLRLNKKITLQIILIFLGILIIFFTYFYDKNRKSLSKKIEEKKTEIEGKDQGISTFENIQYEGIDNSENKFVINSEYAEFKSDKTNIIYMKKMSCRFFFKDGTVLKIASDKGVYDTVSSDMEFEQNVKMYYLENRLFSEKASFINSENYLVIQDNVVGEAPEGNLIADKLDFDLTQKKLKISMYNQDKVNIKVNY
jgi:LPS export ABC transporter protein LptC